MRKTTAYGRKLARQGRRNELSGVEHAVHAASILKAISTRRSREAPPMPGGECLEDIGRNTARDSELKVRAALESLLHGTETLDRDQDLATLNAALVLGLERMLQILFRTERPRADAVIDLNRLPQDARESVQRFVLAREAINRARERWEQHGQWGLDGPGRGDLVAGIDLYSQLLHDSTPEQMTAAWREADRLLRELYKQETSHELL